VTSRRVTRLQLTSAVRLLIEAADAGTASLVEAGIDDVRITRQ
jgi:hypothetical protein